MDVGVEFAFDHVQQLITGSEQADHRVISGYHDLYLGSWLPRGLALGFALGFTRLPVAVRIAPGAQVIVSAICQFDAFADPEDHPPSVMGPMVSAVRATR